MRNHLVQRLQGLDEKYELHCLSSDIRANFVPRDARRGLFPHELEAKVNFAAIADDADRQSKEIATGLINDRAAYFAALVATLSQSGSIADFLGALAAIPILGFQKVGAGEQLFVSSARRIQGQLTDVAKTASRQLAGEAAAQGAAVAPVEAFSARTEQMIIQQANRLTVLPHLDATKAVIDATIELPSTSTVDKALGLVTETGQRLSTKSLDSYARQGVSSGIGLGRIATVETALTPRRIFASELLDSNTCGPCSLVDGKEYQTIDDLLKDYPAGIYVRCEGGMLCRGTPVFVWNESE